MRRRYAAAMRLAGGMTGETLWHFPMPQHLEGCDKKTILAHWNQLHGNRAEDELIRQLVLSLRIWRPSVIVTEHPASKIGLSSLLGEAVQEAVRRAADARAFPEQITELGLEAWTVSKVYGLGKSQDTPSLTQDNDELKESLKGSVRDYAAAGHALLVDRYTPLPKYRSHELLATDGTKTGTLLTRHWMEGLDHKVGESKRDVKPNDKTDVKLMQALLATAQRHRAGRQSRQPGPNAEAGIDGPRQVARRARCPRRVCDCRALSPSAASGTSPRKFTCTSSIASRCIRCPRRRIVF